MLEVVQIDGKPFTLKKGKDNLYKLTKEELDKLIDTVYTSGMRIGMNLQLNKPNTTYITYPWWPSPNNIGPIITCYNNLLDRINNNVTNLNNNLKEMIGDNDDIRNKRI